MTVMTDAQGPDRSPIDDARPSADAVVGAPAVDLDEVYADAPLEVLEDDETMPPRPEEELADIERAEPDPH